MAEPAVPMIDCEQHHASLWVRNVDAAVTFYREQLGFQHSFTWGDPPTMAGMILDRVQIFLELGEPGPRGGLVYFVVGDADELFDFHSANGVDIVQAPTSQEYNLRDYTVRDPDGNFMTFGHRLPSADPPLEIERIHLPLRLEKRLAALLIDLAERKHMSVDSCVEEILLHSCEPLGDGVASPHTKGQLRYIQTLKTKHGIDYDCHASYRFIER